MGAKKVNQYWMIRNGVMTGTASLLSAAQSLTSLDNAGIEITWTGTPTGTISILGSVSEIILDAPAINYYELSFNPALGQPAGSADGYLIDLNQFPFPYVKVQYVNNSGSGVLNAYLFGKDLN